MERDRLLGGASQFQPPSSSCSPEQALQQPVDLGAEIGARPQDPPVDAGLGLPVEEGPAVELPPGDALPHEVERPADLRVRRIRAQLPQEGEGVVGRHPVVFLVVAPMAVGRLEAEQPGAPTLRGDARPLGSDDLVGLIGEVAHDLPADRRIRIEQPLHDSCSASHGSLRGDRRQAAIQVTGIRRNLGRQRPANPVDRNRDSMTLVFLMSPDAPKMMSVSTRTAPVTICCSSGVTPARPSAFCTKARTSSAIEHAAERAAAAEDVHAAEHHGSDHGQLEPDGIVGTRAREIGGEHDRRQSRHDAGSGEDPEQRPVDVDAGEAGGLAVVADRVERPAPMRGVQIDGESDEERHEDGQLQGIGVPPIVPKPMAWYHSGKLLMPRSLRMICAMPR